MMTMEKSQVFFLLLFLFNRIVDLMSVQFGIPYAEETVAYQLYVLSKLCRVHALHKRSYAHT